VLLLELLLLVDELLFVDEELLFVDELLLLVDDDEEFELELLLFEEVLLASLAASSFFVLQEASYCFPFFLKEATLMVTPLSSHPIATARSTWHLPLSLALAGFWT
jgi:hypothetical protein